MASRALQFRLTEAERQLAELKANATHLQEQATQLGAKIAALRISLASEESPPPAAAPEPSAHSFKPATPPPLPPQPEPKPPSPPAPPATAITSDAPPPTAPRPAPVATPQSPIPSLAASSPPPSASLPEEREGFELHFGRVWFVRIGIGLLLTGFVFLSTYAYQNFIVNWSAGARVATLYTAAALLTAVGFFLERWKENLRNYGRVVAAGGWAAIYYTTYAAHYVDRLRIIESPAVAAVLLTLVALCFFAYAAWRKSSVLTVGALALAFYATAINPMGWLGCFSGLLLSSIGIIFFLRYRWLQTGIASLAGAYLSYFYWHGFVNPEAAADPTRWFLLGYWLVFTAALLAPQARQHTARFLVGFASANNLLFFFLFSFRFDSGSWVSDLGLHALVFGAVLLGLAIIFGRLREYPSLLGEVLLAKGLALITWGFCLELSGDQLFLTLTIESLVLAFLWRRTRSPIFRAFVWIPTIIAALLAHASLVGITEAAPFLAYLAQGVLLVVLALLMRGEPFLDAPRKEFSVEGTVASLLALAIPTGALHRTVPTPTPELGLWMLGIGLALWIAYLIRPRSWSLPELVWLGQLSAALGALLTLFTTDSVPQLAFLAGAAGLAFQLHGWTSDRGRPISRPDLSQACEWAFTILTLSALGVLIHRGIEDVGDRLLVYTAVPLLAHFYGSVFRRSAVAMLAQLFYLPTLGLSAVAWSAFRGVDAPSQSIALAALLIAAAHLVVVHLLPNLKFRDVFRESHLLLASILWAGWCASFLDPWWLVFAWTGCALFFLPERYRATMHPTVSLAFLVVGTAGLSLFETDQFWLRYLALPAPFIVHLLASRQHTTGDNSNLPLWAGLATLIVVALATVVSQHTLELFDGKGLSICWALLGLALFGVGLGVQVRTYRFGGLTLLALSLGHVLAVDVWKLETILRILSFLTLGLVLLSLGFVYNRWHAQLRKLL